MRKQYIPCQRPDADPDLWFGENKADVAEAKELCSRCPLRAACLREALQNKTEHGVWGGMSALERFDLLGIPLPAGARRRRQRRKSGPSSAGEGGARDERTAA